MFWNVLEVGMGDLPVLEKRLMTFRWVPDLLPRQDNARLSKTCKFKPVWEECGSWSTDWELGWGRGLMFGGQRAKIEVEGRLRDELPRRGELKQVGGGCRRSGPGSRAQSRELPPTSYPWY